MSDINDDTLSDEDDSYQAFGKTNEGYNIEEASSIEDSNDSNIDIETSQKHDESNNISVSRPPRESTIFPVRKKPVRLVDSEDDDETESDKTLDKPRAGSVVGTTLDEDNNDVLNTFNHQCSNGSDDGSRSLLTVTKKISTILSGSEEEIETQIPKATVSAEKPEKIASDTPTQVKLDKPHDHLNLSSEIRPARISQNFQYDSEGILNSTAIHPGNQNKIWRLSTNVSEVQEESPDDSVEILSDHDSDIIEVSSDEQEKSPWKPPFKLPRTTNGARQQTLHTFIVKKEATTPQSKKPVAQAEERRPLVDIPPTNNRQKVTVTRKEYETQSSKVSNLEMDYIRLQDITKDINYEALPDKGQLVIDRLKMAKDRYRQEKDKLENMDVSTTKVDEAPQGAFANLAWEDIEAGANAVLPKTFGKTAMSTYHAQKAVTLDRLQQLHTALETCPKEDEVEDDPEGIKVPLMPHQKRALAWVMFREKEKPSGGILADDMGLGKTLTMISLIVKSLELEHSGDSSDEENQYVGKNTKFNGGSLIVCPASLINQWSGEIDRRLQRGLVSYLLYHGPKRETRAKKLAEYDIVITTYAIMNNEAEKMSAAFKVKWRRVILDEAHTIRNHKAQTSMACCQLSAKSRWALTGTPMHNKELDMYALLKFLRCSPFDDLQVWKRWVGDKSSGGLERLHTVISSLMLRRTKAELMEKGALNCMPEKKWELIQVELDRAEMHVYHKVMIFSQTLFAQFLHQRAEKNQAYVDQKFTSNQAPNQEYHKMRQKLMKLNKVKDVSQHEILVLLLRLRQICCHPSLITAMLDESREDIGEGDEECEELNLLDQLEKLNIEDEDEYQPEGASSSVAQGLAQDDKITLKEASKGHLKPSDPVFAKDRASSKIKALLKVLQERVITKEDKAIIVSQWSSYLKLVAVHLKDYDIEFDQLDGMVPVNKRMAMVDRLNDPKDTMKVLLLSLTAGGVGLNLVGANHLFLLDLHWNPQLENQAQDRIYRVGQTKPVFVYKFMAKDTIEERIKALQDKKLAMAEGLLTGSKQATQSKLSLADLQMIFGMQPLPAVL